MNNKQISVIIIVLLVLSLLTNAALILVLKEKEGLTGFAVTADQPVAFEDDVIEISKADLKSCCSFINAEGKEDHCYVLKDYECSYCSDYCQ